MTEAVTFHQALLRHHTQQGTPYGGTGKSARQMHDEARAMYDAQPMTTRCARCDWVYQGTAAEGRDEFRRHKSRHRKRKT